MTILSAIHFNETMAVEQGRALKAAQILARARREAIRVQGARGWDVVRLTAAVNGLDASLIESLRADSLLERGFQQATTQIGIVKGDTPANLSYVIDGSALSQLQNEAVTMMVGVEAKLKGEIKEAIETGIARGESAAEMKERVFGLVGKTPFKNATHSAEMRARTISNSLVNAGKQENYKAFNNANPTLTVSNQWFNISDSRSSPLCKSLTGQIREVGVPFSSGHLRPPAHPFCRSTLVPVFKEGLANPPIAPIKLRQQDNSIDNAEVGEGEIRSIEAKGEGAAKDKWGNFSYKKDSWSGKGYPQATRKVGKRFDGRLALDSKKVVMDDLDGPPDPFGTITASLALIKNNLLNKSQPPVIHDSLRELAEYIPDSRPARLLGEYLRYKNVQTVAVPYSSSDKDLADIAKTVEVKANYNGRGTTSPFAAKDFKGSLLAGGWTRLNPKCRTVVINFNAKRAPYVRKADADSAGRLLNEKSLRSGDLNPGARISLKASSTSLGETFIHEVGHLIHANIGKEALPPGTLPTSIYATTNHLEHFAELTLTAVLYPDLLKKYRPDDYAYIVDAMERATKNVKP